MLKVFVPALLLTMGFTPAIAQEQPRVEYLVDTVDFDANWTISSDPNSKKPPPNNKMTVHTHGVHNFSKPILFLAVEMSGFTKDGAEISLSPYDGLSEEERKNAPLYARQDKAMATIWFSELWPKNNKHTFPLIVMTNFAILKNLYSLGYSSYAIGHEPADALSLLADPLIPTDARKNFAISMSKATGRRYRYLDEQENWAVPKELGTILPVTSMEEQVTSDILIDSDASEGGSEIVTKNYTKNRLYIGVAGNGRRDWWKVDPKQEGIFELSPGLFALTIWDREYRTHTVLVKAGRRYRLDIHP